MGICGWIILGGLAGWVASMIPATIPGRASSAKHRRRLHRRVRRRNHLQLLRPLRREPAELTASAWR